MATITNATIQFDNTYEFEGRNGTFKCTGIKINNHLDENEPGEGYITLLPITSRGIAGRAMIDIEGNKLEEFIYTLQKMKNKNK